MEERGVGPGEGRRLFAAARAAAGPEGGQEGLVSGLAAERTPRGHREKRLRARRAERPFAQRLARSATVGEQERRNRLEEIAKEGSGHAPQRLHAPGQEASGIERQSGDELVRECRQLARLPAAGLLEGALYFGQEPAQRH